MVYAELVKVLLLACALSISTWAQGPGTVPRFEDFLVTETVRGTPAQPVLTTLEERRFRTVIRQGVTKGWGVEDGTTGKELAVQGPNFAGRYVIVRWGCGSPCLMMAIVDSKTGRVFPPPFHHGPGHSYFQLPWAFPMEPPLAFRVDSRLLIAKICESHKAIQVGGRMVYEAQMCEAHYFVMGDNGLTLIHRVLEK